MLQLDHGGSTIFDDIGLEESYKQQVNELMLLDRGFISQPKCCFMTSFQQQVSVEYRLLSCEKHPEVLQDA